MILSTFTSSLFAIQRICSYGSVSRRISYIIFIFQTIFQNIKLQDTYNTYNNFFHTGIKLLKNLNSTFLRDLIDTFNKLFSLHSIKSDGLSTNVPVQM